MDPLLSFLSGSSRCTFQVGDLAWLRIALKSWRVSLNSRNLATAIVLTVELNGLTGLLTEIVYNHGLNRHLDDVTGMGPVELSAEQFGEIVVNPHRDLHSKLIG